MVGHVSIRYLHDVYRMISWRSVKQNWLPFLCQRKNAEEKRCTHARQCSAATEWRHPSCFQKVLERDEAVPEATGADRHQQHGNKRRCCLGDRGIKEELDQHLRPCEDEMWHYHLWWIYPDLLKSSACVQYLSMATIPRMYILSCPPLYCIHCL